MLHRYSYSLWPPTMLPRRSRDCPTRNTGERHSEVAGPEKFRLDEFIRRCLSALGDSREVVADPNSLYSGARLSERTLVPEATRSSERSGSKTGSLKGV